jgi:hypothetical protein
LPLLVRDLLDGKEKNEGVRKNAGDSTVCRQQVGHVCIARSIIIDHDMRRRPSRPTHSVVLLELAREREGRRAGGSGSRSAAVAESRTLRCWLMRNDRGGTEVESANAPTSVRGARPPRRAVHGRFEPFKFSKVERERGEGRCAPTKVGDPNCVTDRRATTNTKLDSPQ